LADRRRRAYPETAALGSATLLCSTWQGIRTCSSPDGYVSHESTWQGLTTGDDNQGNRWTTSRWRDMETTTVDRPGQDAR
jgi:hypothetical protein